jgi:hypothetical protein
MAKKFTAILVISAILEKGECCQVNLSSILLDLSKKGSRSHGLGLKIRSIQLDY